MQTENAVPLLEVGSHPRPRTIEDNNGDGGYWILVDTDLSSCYEGYIMLVVAMKRLCRVGLAAALVTAFFVLTLVDMPQQIADLPADLSPTPGNFWVNWFIPRFG